MEMIWYLIAAGGLTFFCGVLLVPILIWLANKSGAIIRKSLGKIPDKKLRENLVNGIDEIKDKLGDSFESGLRGNQKKKK